jgi:membrane protease YdiL (CAAX protease family)
MGTMLAKPKRAAGGDRKTGASDGFRRDNRGLMIPHFLQRMRFRTANVLQASLYSAWHGVWPVRAYLTGNWSVAAALSQAGPLLAGTFVAGLVYGYLFWRTGSL